MGIFDMMDGVGEAAKKMEPIIAELPELMKKLTDFLNDQTARLSRVEAQNQEILMLLRASRAPDDALLSLGKPTLEQLEANAANDPRNMGEKRDERAE